jgi:hypothetical protein
MTDWEAEFKKLSLKEFYPGSTTPINRNKPIPVHDKTGQWDENPRFYKVNGVEVEFFTVGHLAAALGRKPVTIRKWENDGVIPKATYQRNSEDSRGRRRLYTRDQVEGILKIAKEEGILRSHNKPIKSTMFTTRVIQLFKDLLNG